MNPNSSLIRLFLFYGPGNKLAYCSTFIKSKIQTDKLKFLFERTLHITLNKFFFLLPVYKTEWEPETEQIFLFSFRLQFLLYNGEAIMKCAENTTNIQYMCIEVLNMCFQLRNFVLMGVGDY